MENVKRRIALLLMMALAACASPGPVTPRADNVHDALAALAAKYHVCAVAVAVIKHRQLELLDAASGCTPAVAVGPDSVFQAASLSKPLFAYAVLKLVAQGRLTLDAPVTRYLPQGYRHRFAPLTAAPVDLVRDPRLQDVTVRMLLNHTAGLPNWADGPLRFDSAPASRWAYSGEGYVLLQRAVEQVTGQGLDQVMRELVFQPLAMDHSDYVLNDAIAPRLLQGTKANGAPRAVRAFTEPVAAFSLYTTAADYGKWLVALLNDEAMLKQMSAAPVVVDPALGLSWGLGLGIEHTPSESFVWQWGNNTGYRAFAIAGMASGDGLVMLTNSENGLELAQALAQQVLPADHRLFASPILGTDLINLLCNTVRVCM